MMTSLPGQRRSMAYPSHESSLLTRPKGRAARLKPAGGDGDTGEFMLRPHITRGKIHRHKINRQQQRSVYRRFKQTGHYTAWSNGGGGVKTIHLPDSVVVECRLRKEVESTTGGLPRQREGLRLENLHLENLHQRRGPSEHSEAGFTEQSSPFVSPALLSLECKKKKAESWQSRLEHNPFYSVGDRRG